MSSVRIGANDGDHGAQRRARPACNDATLTLPGVPKQVGWTGGAGARDINGAQIRIGNIAPGETMTIEVRYP